MEKESGVTVVLGGQWGDEGKGKLVDILAQDADVVARCQVTFVSFTPLINTLFFFFSREATMLDTLSKLDPWSTTFTYYQGMLL